MAQRLTQRIELLSQMATEFFPAGSGQGDTHAKPTAWSDPKDFAAKQQQSIADLSKLAAAAQSGNAATFRTEYLTAAGSCKECHETYRERQGLLTFNRSLRCRQSGGQARREEEA